MKTDSRRGTVPLFKSPLLESYRQTLSYLFLSNKRCLISSPIFRRFSHTHTSGIPRALLRFEGYCGSEGSVKSGGKEVTKSRNLLSVHIPTYKTHNGRDSLSWCRSKCRVGLTTKQMITSSIIGVPNMRARVK